VKGVKSESKQHTGRGGEFERCQINEIGRWGRPIREGWMSIQDDTLLHIGKWGKEKDVEDSGATHSL